VIKVYHAIAPHFAYDFLFIVAARVVRMLSRLGRLFSPAKILPMPLRIGQAKASRAVLSGCFIRVKRIDGYQTITPTKIVIITFEMPIVFPSISGTSSCDEAYREVSWYP
jgi:hypothetical protein